RSGWTQETYAEDLSQLLRPCLNPAHCECDDESNNPHPFSIPDRGPGQALDFRFPIVGRETQGENLKDIAHVFESLNRKSRIGNRKCHLMTLSALANTFGGIVNPICLAVFRLITNSNLVGASTGRSAGFAPLMILST